MSYWSRTYEGVPEQLSAVRQYTRDVLGDGPGVDDVVLVVSELAANAIRHTLSGEPDGVFVLHVADFTDYWQVRVDDQGSPKTPGVADPDDSEIAGWGLAVVGELAEKWDVAGDEYARAIWAVVLKPKPTKARA